jgi:phosphatidylglycerophosphate synthase
VTSKLTRLWAAKSKDDEWWSSFVTSPIAIIANCAAVDHPWITPNRITAMSFLVAIAASIFVIVGGFSNFIIAAVLIHLSHVLDCMDGQLARYRQVSSPLGSYYDRITDQVQVIMWFGAVGYAAYYQTGSVTPVFLALIGIAFYGLRGYIKYVAIEIEMARDLGYAIRIANEKKTEITAGLGFDFRANLTWFVREQPKILQFNEGVFIFMLSAALLFDGLEAMLWIFAASQVLWSLRRAVEGGSRIHKNTQLPIQK